MPEIGTSGSITDMFDLQQPRHIPTYMRTPLSRGYFGGA